MTSPLTQLDNSNYDHLIQRGNDLRVVVEAIFESHGVIISVSRESGAIQ